MYKTEKHPFEKFEKKVWLASPTMYPESMKYAMEAYETNWMSTVGENINELEKIAAKTPCQCTTSLPFQYVRIIVRFR